MPAIDRVPPAPPPPPAPAPLLEGAARVRAPLLDGELALRARAAVDDIAAALRDPPPPGGDAASLAGGAAGEALLHAAVARLDPGGPHADAANAALDRALDAVASEPMSYGLHGGFTGVAFVLDANAGDGGDGPAETGIDCEDPNRDTDEALLELLARRPWRGPYDLIDGLVGVGVYASARGPRGLGRDLLQHVLARLSELATRDGDGLAIHTVPDLLPAAQRARHPDGHVDVGLAHGLAGVVALAGAAVAAGVGGAVARALLDGTARWLLAHRLPPSVAAGGAVAREDERGLASLFPSMIVPGAPPERSRVAWCYGDPGVALALFGAARRAGEPAWAEAALEVARHVAALPPERTGVVDAGLCHGALGLAHVLHRFHRATGEPLFADAARAWTARGLDLRRPGEGVAGFLSWSPLSDGNGAGGPRFGWTAERGLLVGAAGIGLALVAALDPAEPSWDRALQLDL